MWWTVVLVVVLRVEEGLGGQELLKDHSFEEEGAPAWKSYGFHMASTTSDVLDGKKALLCTGRTAKWQGPGQSPPLKLGGRYRFHVSVKMLKDKPGVLFQDIRLTGAFHWKDADETTYMDLADHPMVGTKDGWFSLNADFVAPIRPWSSARLYLQGPDVGVDFAVDNASLVELPEDSDWRVKARAKVEEIRKSNVTFRSCRLATVSEFAFRVPSILTAGPSGTGMNDQVLSDCQGEFSTGCGAYNWMSAMDGALPISHSCAAQNGGTQVGVYSYAACCEAPNMSCVVKTSQPSDLPMGSNVTITCDTNYVMAGCNVYSQYGNTAGAFITDIPGQPSVCTAINGADKYGGEEGVKAVATCCKVN